MRRHSRILALVLAIFGGLSAHAKSPCVRYLEGNLKLVYDPGSPMDQAHQLERLARVIEVSNTEQFAELAHPTYLELSVYAKTTPAFNAEFWTITQFLEPRDERTAAILDAHEYAHAVFTINMLGYSPDWREWQTSWIKYRNEEDLNEKAELKAIPSLWRISKLYQELFSDLAAIFYDGSYSFYADVLLADLYASAKDKSEETKTAEAARNFMTVTPLENWNVTLAKVSARARSHVLLNPTRSYIYENYLQGQRAIAKSHFMARLFKSLAMELVEKAKAPDFWAIDAETINRDLMQRLEQDLVAFKRPSRF